MMFKRFLVFFLASLLAPGHYKFFYNICPYDKERKRCRIWTCLYHYVDGKYCRFGKCSIDDFYK